MLQNNDNGSAPHKPSLFEHFFLHYGAGAHIFAPLTRARFWNTFCWTIIGLGILGWIAALWFLHGYTE
jgi:hypothetical protein